LPHHTPSTVARYFLHLSLEAGLASLINVQFRAELAHWLRSKLL